MNLPKPLAIVIAVSGLAVVPAVDAATSLPQKKGATYKGVTSQGKRGCHKGSNNAVPCAVTDRVSKDGKTVRSTIYFRATCADGNIYQDNVVIGPLRIKSGKYSFSGTYKETLSDGTKLNNAASTHGTFKRKGKAYRVVGDFRLSSAEVSYTDGTSTRCSSPKATLPAKP